MFLNNRERALAYTAFATVCLVWGTTFLAIRVAIETLPTLLLTGTRFTLAGALLLVICLATKQSFPTRKADWLNLALVGFLMISIGNLAVVWAEHYISSGVTAMLLATGPFWLGVAEKMRAGGGERFSLSKIIGMIIGFLGVTLLVAPEFRGVGINSKFLLGVLALQLACIAWGIGSVRSKYHPSDASLFVAAAIQMAIGGSIVAALGLMSGEASAFSFSPRTLPAFLYLTVFGSIGAYTAYVYALSKLSTATVALYDYIVPAIAVLLGWLILSEPLGWRTLIALALILTGVAFDKVAGRWFVAASGAGTCDTPRENYDSVA